MVTINSDLKEILFRLLIVQSGFGGRNVNKIG